MPFEEQDKIILNSIPHDQLEQEYLEVGVRPWGVYYVLEDKANFKVKKIVVNTGQRLSLQSHKHRSEHWVVISGLATVEIRKTSESKDWVFDLTHNESCYIPATKMHRLANYGKVPLIIIEVQFA